MRISGATVLLTGVTGGIGGALAAGLAGLGAKLVVSGRREEALAPLAERYGARAVLADLADASDVERLPARRRTRTSWSPTRRCRPAATCWSTPRSRSTGRSPSTFGRRRYWPD